MAQGDLRIQEDLAEVEIEVAGGEHAGGGKAVGFIVGEGVAAGPGVDLLAARHGDFHADDVEELELAVGLLADPALDGLQADVVGGGVDLLRAAAADAGELQGVGRLRSEEQDSRGEKHAGE